MTDSLDPPSTELDWPAINRWRGVIDEEFDPGGVGLAEVA